MKKSLPSCLLVSLAVFSLGSIRADAEYVVPRVSPVVSAAHHPSPPNPWTRVHFVTRTSDDGLGSLRHAIAKAAPGDTIRFAPKRWPATILLRSTLVIDKDLVIFGPGPQKLTVARSYGEHTPSFRVFQVDAGVVTIAGLTIANGRALNPDGFSDNLGGGILNAGSLTVSNCVIACNVAAAEGGGNGFGAGIFTLGSLTVLNSTIRGNEANYAGGGICVFQSASVLVRGCTISGNFAGIQGGGVNFQGLTGHFKNSTLSGNCTAEDGTAGALLHLVFENEASALDVTACTVARNHGNTNAAVVLAALPANLGSITRMIGTLVADNAAQNFLLDGDPVLQSLGHSLDSDGTSGLANGVNGDLVGSLSSPLDAQLGALVDNGGPTRTHALLPGSPALDAGVCLDVDEVPLAVDQRGRPRAQGAGCDIGAFENQPPLAHCPAGFRPGRRHGSLTGVVHDADGDALVVVWFVDGAAYKTNFLAGTHPPFPQAVNLNVALSPGDHLIGLAVSDGKAAVDECSTTVTVHGPKPRH